ADAAERRSRRRHCSLDAGGQPDARSLDPRAAGAMVLAAPPLAGLSPIPLRHSEPYRIPVILWVCRLSCHLGWSRQKRIASSVLRSLSVQDTACTEKRRKASSAK